MATCLHKEFPGFSQTNAHFIYHLNRVFSAGFRLSHTVPDRNEDNPLPVLETALFFHAWHQTPA